jgi:hypothetical protein
MAIVAIALRMLLHRRVRAASATIGMSIAFFLTAAQLGVLVGWCNTVSAIVRHTDVDLWVMAERTAAFDYGMPIPENRVYQVRSVPGVDWAEAMLMSWVFSRASRDRARRLPWRADVYGGAVCLYLFAVSAPLRAVLSPG